MVPEQVGAGRCLDLRRIFVLEDDRWLLGDLQRLLDSEGWCMIHACSLETAKSVATANAHDVCIALVDMMIPNDDEALKEVHVLMEDRERKIAEWTNREKTADFSLEQLKLFRDELQVIDHQVGKLIQIDGGMEFLKFLDSNTEFAHWKLFIFSARDAEEPGLRQAVEQAFGNKKLAGWLSKPISPFDLIRQLQFIMAGEQ